MPEDKDAANEMQVVLFCLGKHEFGVPISQVKEIIMMPDVTVMPNAPSFIEGIINLRGQIIAILDLLGRFDLPRTERVEDSRIVVVQTADETVGIIVDTAPKVLRVPLTEIEPAPTFIASKIPTRYVEGVGKKGDQLFIMLNLEELLSTEEVGSVYEMKKREIAPEAGVATPE